MTGEIVTATPTGWLAALRQALSNQQRARWTLGIIVLAALLAPWSIYDKLWAVAYGICPQRPAHSLFHGGIQMPIEARETGLFGGFVVGLVAMSIFGRLRGRGFTGTKILALLIVFVGILGIDGLNAVAYDLYLPTLYAPQLYLRLGTGLLAGLSLAGFMVPTFNQIAWKSAPPDSPLGDWRQLGAAFVLLAVFFAAAVSGAGVLLYPVAVVVIGGQLVLMTLLGAALTTPLLGLSNRAARWADLAPAVLLALVGVMLVLGASSTVRYLLFGPGPMPTLR
ncbi:MAG: DUF2085 domain-containing protein [Anaerolineales bacterium]